MPTTEQLIPPMAIGAGRRRRRGVGRLVLLVIVAIVGGAGYFGYTTLMTNSGQPSCIAVALGHDVSFSPEQTANAATITAVALKRGLPARAATIANATAIQESKLRNVRFGDRDSLGLFQQRPSQGWGTAEQILDPVYATNKFYDALIKINGYQAMEITKVAQLVQRSATPQAYASHEQEGRILASTLAGHSPGGIGCRLDAATVSTPGARGRCPVMGYGRQGHRPHLGDDHPTLSAQFRLVCSVQAGSWPKRRAPERPELSKGRVT